MPRLCLRLSFKRFCSIAPSTKRPVWPPSSYRGEILSNQLRFLAMRHLHPQKVAILCGLFPSYVSPHAAIPLKLDLAGVGQLASPIQFTWICAHVMHAMGRQGLVDRQPTPHQRLGNLLKVLLQERDQLVKRDTPTTSM